jgi:hypothetical protein
MATSIAMVALARSLFKSNATARPSRRSATGPISMGTVTTARGTSMLGLVVMEALLQAVTVAVGMEAMATAEMVVTLATVV